MQTTRRLTPIRMASTQPDSFPPPTLRQAAEEVANLLKARQETVAVAETAAGGLISSALLSTPGASKIYKGGLTVRPGLDIHAAIRHADPVAHVTDHTATTSYTRWNHEYNLPAGHKQTLINTEVPRRPLSRGWRRT